MSRKPALKRTKAQKRHKAASVLCNTMGTLILLLIVAICLPLTVPRFMGYEIYDVVSGSMEPEIPVNSIVYVQSAEPGDIEVGEILAFWSDGSVVIHRVRENRKVEGEFITRGDANDMDDVEPVSYDAVVGVVVYHLPVLGRLSVLYTSVVGKVYALGFVLAAVLFYILAGRLKALSIPEKTEDA